jgi:8-hydroxy-5-deazaflavin:NADPH oxidoreductase
MRIGIIGSGKIGSTAARLFLDAGHEVAISNSRPPASMRTLVAELGDGARAATVEDAASFGELVLVAIPFERYRELPAAALAGKIVIDAMNRYPGGEAGPTSTELLAAHLPDGRVVKAFNTMYWQLLRDRGRPRGGDDRLVLFVAGDDREAKDRVSRLMEEIGFTPVDTGGLAAGARRQQPGSPIYTELARRRREQQDPPGFTERDAEAALMTAGRRGG